MENVHAHDTDPNIMRLIAIFKLVSGFLLLAVALGVLRLMRGDIADLARYWLEELRVDPRSHFINTLLTQLTGINRRTLAEVGAGSFLYAALLLTEGTGLLLRKRWAEYLTVVATGAFIPLEIYEVIKNASVGKVVLLVLNVAIVWYLAMRIRNEGKSSTKQSLAPLKPKNHSLDGGSGTK